MKNESNQKIQSKVKIHHYAIVRAPGLLPMKYKLSEISKELDIPQRTLHDWLRMGVPHERDERNHIWINGQEFAKWINSNRKRRSSNQKLKANEGYCFRCNRVVNLVSPIIMPARGKLIFINGYCPFCKGKIVRGGRQNGQSK